MKKKDKIQFGKKLSNEYKIIERRFKDNNTYFYIEITDNLDSVFGIIPEKYIFEQRFDTYDEAFDFIRGLKVEDGKITVLEEKIHTLSAINDDNNEIINKFRKLLEQKYNSIYTNDDMLQLINYYNCDIDKIHQEIIKLEAELLIVNYK